MTQRQSSKTKAISIETIKKDHAPLVEELRKEFEAEVAAKPLSLDDLKKNHGAVVEELRLEILNNAAVEIKAQKEVEKAAPRFKTYAPGKYKR